MRLVNHTSRGFIIGVILICAFYAVVVDALTIEQAKAQGLVGEQPNGYVGTVLDNPTQELRTLVNSVNAIRRQQYLSIANANHTSLQSVEQVAGQTAITKTPSGYYIRNTSGVWIKK